MFKFKNLFLFFSLLTIFSTITFAARKKVVIIGGGIAGVSSTFFMTSLYHDTDIILLEKEEVLGGNARTVSVPNGLGQNVMVDIGPQYIAEGGWDLYIAMLKEVGLWNDNEWHVFSPTITVFSKDPNEPDFYTPQMSRKYLKYKHKKDPAMKEAFRMLKFFDRSYKHYKNDSLSSNVTVGNYLDDLSMNAKFKKDVLLPIIASTVNAKISNARSMSMKSVLGYLAFQSPWKPQKFMVSKIGIGTLVQKLAERIRSRGSNIKYFTNSPVHKVKTLPGDKYEVHYGVGKKIIADFVVFATHPYSASKILRFDSKFKKVRKILDKFTYVDTKVVIHNDRSLLPGKYDAFYNIKVKKNGQYYMGMNCSAISPKYGDIIKSWGFNKRELIKLKSRNKVLAVANFKHPNVTPEFLSNNTRLRYAAAKFKTLFFIGGWREVHETQDTAIISGFRILDRISRGPSTWWRKKFPQLKGKSYMSL